MSEKAEETNVEQADVSPESTSQFADDEGEAAVAWQQLPPEREFFATPYDPPVKSLVQEIRDKELIVRPTFQRYAVWDHGRKSKFVESLLLSIPIPNLFFAEDDDKTKVVVDGQQRLIAVKEFLENQYPLKSLEVLTALNGKRFDDLTERQQKIIRNTTLRCLLISARSDSEIRFQVFERLNQGGVPLNAQEVRHCVYRGSLNDLLHQLVKNALWLKLVGQREPHPRMVDCELILRFFSIRHSLPKYAPPLKTLLNTFMRDHRNPEAKELAELQKTFELAIAPVATVFGDEPFRRVYVGPDKEIHSDRSINRAVFDVQTLVMEGLDLGWAKAKKIGIVEAFKKLCLSDQAFADAVSRATADKARMEYRLRKWKDALVSLGADLRSAARLP